MKLSILIPMFNAEAYIEKCLSCLKLNLAEEDYEIIIADDGSTDNSKALARLAASNRSNIHIHTFRNEGAYATRNKLLALAKGDYIYHMDIDDLVNPAVLSQVVKFAHKEGFDFVGFETVYFEQHLSSYSVPSLQQYTSLEFLQQFPEHRFEVWWYIVKREFLNANEIVFENNQANADVGYTFEVLTKASKLGFLPLPGICYRQTTDSIIRTSNPRKLEALIANNLKMIMSFTERIETYSRKLGEDVHDVSTYFKRRRDGFVIDMLIRSLHKNVHFEDFQFLISALKDQGLLPLNRLHFGETRKKNKIYGTLIYLFSRQSGLLKLLKRYKPNRAFVLEQKEMEVDSSLSV